MPEHVHLKFYYKRFNVSAEPFEDAIMTQSPAAGPSAAELHKVASVDNSSPLLVRAAALRALEELEDQAWYHGEMSRRQAEKLLLHDGDFLVRKSTTNPGSYVLTGMHNGLAKHLLLVDPEGTVRERENLFDHIIVKDFSCSFICEQQCIQLLMYF